MLIYFNNDKITKYYICLSNENCINFFSYLNSDYIIMYTIKGLFMEKLLPIFKGMYTKSSKRVSYMHNNGKFDCITFANWMNYGVAYSNFRHKRNYPSSIQEQSIQLDDFVPLGKTIMMCNSTDWILHMAISLGLRDTFTDEVLFISKYGSECGIFISTLRQLLKIYPETHFVYILKPDDRFNPDLSFYDKNDISKKVLEMDTPDFPNPSFTEQYGNFFKHISL